MSAADHLGTYAEGWTKGDANLILNAVADDYTFDDPNAGKITKSEFTEYLSGMKETVRSLRGGTAPRAHASQALHCSRRLFARAFSPR